MKSFLKTLRFRTALLLLAVCSFTSIACAANSLSLGADYLLRGVSITERDRTIPTYRYYDQRLIGYLVTDLSRDVEATIRIQSITAWGLEGGTDTLNTRYPHANGDLWVQNAFVRLPNIWEDRVAVTIGRQPIIWGDGLILSDDELGFNAIRAHVQSPWRWLPLDVDGFTAKVEENTPNLNDDADVHGVVLGLDSERYRWELMGLWDKSQGDQLYQLGAETAPVVSANIDRIIYGVRAQTNLRDAFLRAEYYMQGGKMTRGVDKVDFGGDAYAVGIGGKQNTQRFGRFGAILEIAEGSGDKAAVEQGGRIDSGGKDEAFRPRFAHRWSGLERTGFGRYYGATLSDARSPGNPFAPADSTNTGLPEGASGIQTIHFGIESTPWSPVTVFFDYFQYKANQATDGKKELGSEFDYGVEYRYSGLVSIRATMSTFSPGEAYDQPQGLDPSTARKAKWNAIELIARF